MLIGSVGISQRWALRTYQDTYLEMHLPELFLENLSWQFHLLQTDIPKNHRHQDFQHLDKLLPKRTEQQQLHLSHCRLSLRWQPPLLKLSGEPIQPYHFDNL